MEITPWQMEEHYAIPKQQKRNPKMYNSQHQHLPTLSNPKLPKIRQQYSCQFLKCPAIKIPKNYKPHKKQQSLPKRGTKGFKINSLKLQLMQKQQCNCLSTRSMVSGLLDRQRRIIGRHIFC